MTQWQPRTVLGRFFESATVNGKRLTVSQTPNRRYTARIDGRRIPGSWTEHDRARQAAITAARNAA